MVQLAARQELACLIIGRASPERTPAQMRMLGWRTTNDLDKETCAGHRRSRLSRLAPLRTLAGAGTRRALRRPLLPRSPGHYRTSPPQPPLPPPPPSCPPS